MSAENLTNELDTRAATIAHEMWPAVNHEVRSDERVRDETLIALGIKTGFMLAIKTTKIALENTRG